MENISAKIGHFSLEATAEAASFNCPSKTLSWHVLIFKMANIVKFIYGLLRTSKNYYLVKI